LIPEFVLFFSLGLLFGLLVALLVFFLQKKDKSRLAEENRDLKWDAKRNAELMRTKEELWSKGQSALSDRFAALASNILEERSKHWGDSQQKQLDTLLRPFHQNLQEFKKQVQDTYVKETQDRSALQKEIQILRELNQKMSSEANALAQAIKGSSKQQGIWGEMVLERILELAGLHKGREYEVQTLFQGEEGRGMPDAVVHLPGEKDIVVDAKVSLLSYERFVREQNSEARDRFQGEHLRSLKKHVDGLSARDYTRLEGIRTLDFVFMFVPIEGALGLALDWDPHLMDYALRKRVFLVGPSTLLAALKAVEFQWKTDRQNKSAQKIAQEAGKLLDKILRVFEDVEKLEQLFSQERKVLDSLQGRLKRGPGNVLSRLRKVKDMGAEHSKVLPEGEG
jgi:DNA recombination protein RmuC